MELAIGFAELGLVNPPKRVDSFIARNVVTALPEIRRCESVQRPEARLADGTKCATKQNIQHSLLASLNPPCQSSFCTHRSLTPCSPVGVTPRPQPADVLAFTPSRGELKPPLLQGLRAAGYQPPPRAGLGLWRFPDPEHGIRPPHLGHQMSDAVPPW